MSEQPDGLGPTGDYPEGKLGPHDEGGLRIAIGVKAGNVVIDLGAPTAWFAMGPAQARALAEILVKRAREAEARAHGNLVGGE